MKQIWSVLCMNFLSLRTRIWPSLVVVVGMACVIGVLLSLLSFTAGLARVFENAGDPGKAIVVSLSAEGEGRSSLPRNTFPIVADAPGIMEDFTGKPLAEAEAIFNVPMTNKILHSDGTMMVRGVGPQSVALRPKFKLLEGRLFHPGSRELIVGRATQNQFSGTQLGDKVILPDGEWPIVGVFTTDGDVAESAFFADRETVMAANRKTAFNSVLVQLTSPAAYEMFRRAVIADPTLSVSVERQSTYYLRTVAQAATLFNNIAYAVGIVMAIGAMFGALNTMYAAVDARTREIATLRALGFGSFPVILSVITEAMFLATIGALIGAAVAWAFFDGNSKAAGPYVFVITMTHGLIMTGVVWALIVGLLGALLPSIRAARLPIATAIRAS